MNSFRISERNEFKMKPLLLRAKALRVTVMPREHRASGIRPLSVRWFYGFCRTVRLTAVSESSAAGFAKETSRVDLLTRDFH